MELNKKNLFSMLVRLFKDNSDVLDMDYAHFRTFMKELEKLLVKRPIITEFFSSPLHTTLRKAYIGNDENMVVSINTSKQYLPINEAFVDNFCDEIKQAFIDFMGKNMKYYEEALECDKDMRFDEWYEDRFKLGKDDPFQLINYAFTWSDYDDDIDWETMHRRWYKHLVNLLSQ